MNNNKILVGVGIFVVTVIFFIFTQITEYNTENFQLLDTLYLGGPLIAGIFSLAVAQKSKFHGLFGISYLVFGIALFMDFLGESIFIYYEVVLKEDPYPSIADIFYGSFFFLAGFFILKNILYFHPKFSIKYLLVILTIIFVISGAYASMSYEVFEEIGFDFWYGLAFVIGSSTILGLSVTSILVFERSVIGYAWGFLAAGITINTIADVWYANLELFEAYHGTHIVNSIWFCSWLVISYALIKHWKIPQ